MPRASRELLVLVASLSACPAWGFDVGDPWFDSPMDGDIQPVKYELIFEEYERDTRYVPTEAVITTTELGTLNFGAGNAFEGESQGEFSIFRFTVAPDPMVNFQFDLGYDGETSFGDHVLLLGATSRVLLSERENRQLALQVSATLFPSTSLEWRASTLPTPTKGVSKVTMSSTAWR